MSVTKREIVSRGLHLRCPNCGERTLFQTNAMRINRRCPSCRVDLNRGDGFFLGPMVLNYSIAVFLFVIPCILLGASGMFPWAIALGLAAAGCVILPIVFYRLSWSWWLMLYFWFLPERLPANGGLAGGEAED